MGQHSTKIAHLDLVHYHHAFSNAQPSYSMPFGHHPSGWLAATAGIVFCSMFAQLYFARSGAWKVFDPGSIKRIKFMNTIYLFLMIISLAGAFQLYRYPSRIVNIVWGFIVLLLSILALYLNHNGMKAEKKELGIP